MMIRAPRPKPPLSTQRVMLPNGLTVSQLELVREHHRRGLPGLSLAQFVVGAWEGKRPDGHCDPLEAVPLQWNWHIQAVCDHVQALLLDTPGPCSACGNSYVGEASAIVGCCPRCGGTFTPCPQNLLINVPPGSMKSLIFSVFAPAWIWLFRPSWRAIYASGTPSVVTRDSLKCRSLITSEWYQLTFAPAWKISADQNEKQHFANTAGGFRKGVGAGGTVTGERADFLGVDDPNDAAEIHSKAHRATINDQWWDTAFHNRIADPAKSKRGVIMQRLHEEDLTGHVQEKEAGEWTHLCLPMEYESTGPGAQATWLGWHDPRSTEGELLFPERFTPLYLAAERKTLGSAGYAGQMQQRPVAASGNRFQRSWWRFWAPDAQMQPRPKGACATPPIRYVPNVDGRDYRLGSWDCAFKDGDQNDYVVGGVVDIVGSRRIVIERYRKRAAFPETERAIMQQHEDHVPDEIAIEDKANGSAVISTLEAKIPGLVAVEPLGGKEARAAMLEPKVEAGNWYLPEGAPWLDEWIDEFAAFPKGRNDDQVDMASQAEARLLEDPETVNTRLLLGMGLEHAAPVGAPLLPIIPSGN